MLHANHTLLPTVRLIPPFLTLARTPTEGVILMLFR